MTEIEITEINITWRYKDTGQFCSDRTILYRKADGSIAIRNISLERCTFDTFVKTVNKGKHFKNKERLSGSY